jgi:DNA repair exonuclease SbcCD ATPase subunit
MNLHLQEIESLQNSLREREKYVTELENRLRALWDKLEGERKYYMEQINRTESFINRFLDPEDLGYAVNNYVRDDAREALGRERVESKP